jgi:hypothetical protein
MSHIDNFRLNVVVTRPLGVRGEIHVRKFALLALVCLSMACQRHPATDAPKLSSPTPPVAKGVSASTAKLAFDSPEGMTKVLEEKWPIAAIVEFSIPERRHDNRCQNLVAYGEVWKGNLHAKETTGFDKIAWYATTKNGRAEQFSLGVWRGQDFWLLEGGAEESLQRVPNFAPNPNSQCFVGYR